MTKDRSRTVRRIEISRIRIHPDNIRTRLPKIEELTSSVRRQGILVPVVTHQKWDRQEGVQDLELIFGHRRLAAARAAGLVVVPGQTLPRMEPADVLIMMLTERQREDHEDAAIADAVRKLRHRHGLTALQIAEQLGTSEAQVKAWLDGRGDLAAVPLAAPGTPSPAHPTLAGMAPVTSMTPGRKTSRNPAPGLSAHRLYGALAEYEGGRITADELAGRVRGMLGGWRPSSEARTG